jgi:hypothetical protein
MPPMQALFAELLTISLYKDLCVDENPQFTLIDTSIPNQYKLLINGRSMFTFSGVMHSSDTWNQQDVLPDFHFANVEASINLHKKQAKCEIYMTFALRRLFKERIQPVLNVVDAKLRYFPSVDLRRLWMPPFDRCKGQITLTYPLFYRDRTRLELVSRPPLVAHKISSDDDREIEIPWSIVLRGSVI